MKQVSCECGYHAQDQDEVVLIQQVMGHVKESHPELVDKVTPADVQEMMQPVV